MPNVQFDPFGEPAAQRLEAAADGSRAMRRAGVGLFWGLVVAIVATRAALFDAGLEDQLRFVASLAQRAISAII